MGTQLISVFLLLNIFLGGSVLSLLADPSKTDESISSRYARSDQIGPKFQKAYQPLKLNYQWRGNGIILKSGKGKMAKEQFIDGKTGKIKKNIPLDSAKEEGDSLYLPLNQVGIVAPAVPIMYPLPLKIPLIDQSVCTGWILKGILKTMEPSHPRAISPSPPLLVINGCSISPPMI